MINTHMHVFNYEFLPEDFLKIQLDGRMGTHSDLVLKFLESKYGRALLKIFRQTNTLKKVQRYSQFLSVGLYESQYEIYQYIDQIYHSHNPQYCVLSMNMDYMSDKGPGKANYETQLLELIQLKRFVGDKLKLFLFVDPRYKRGDELGQWIDKKFQTGCFEGFKLYPSLGYYPFDPRMEAMWKYADENKLPVTTHCTRYGSFFVGDNIWNIIGEQPESLNPGIEYMNPVYARIERYKNYNGIIKKQLNTNAWLTNLFTHPDNYVPILEKYKNVKLCLAHFGGIDEIFKDKLFSGRVEKVVKKLDTGAAHHSQYVSWYELIKKMMVKYPNCYTDISYVIGNPETHAVILEDMKLDIISDKVLFGTDFYMEMIKMDEKKILDTFIHNFVTDTNAMEKLTEINPRKYLGRE